MAQICVGFDYIQHPTASPSLSSFEDRNVAGWNGGRDAVVIAGHAPGNPSQYVARQLLHAYAPRHGFETGLLASLLPWCRQDLAVSQDMCLHLRHRSHHTGTSMRGEQTMILRPGF